MCLTFERDFLSTITSCITSDSKSFSGLKLSSLVCDFKNLIVTSFSLNENYICALAIAKNNAIPNEIHFHSNPTVDQIVNLIQS